MNPLLFFFQSASAGGVLLFLAAILGLVMANTGLAPYYEHFLHAELGPLPVHLWINDVLMAIFFLQVGLEVKREMIHGELNTNAKRFLPGIGAFFGLICPAIVYTIVNFSYPEYLSGWAIPTATDIAFAIGIVSVLGSRVPISMKVFLTTLAVMDDLMAIVIIALFYTQELAWMYLLGAAAVTALLFYINRIGYIRPIPYLMLGIVLWYCVFRSGLHATLAGVILASAIPFRGMREGRTVSPVQEWEHALTNWVTFLIVPLFGFANTGVYLGHFQISDLFQPVVLGIAIGLFLGKQVGVFGTMYILVKTKLVPMPAAATWTHVYGIALCCGIGFTMSLFVDLLAFPPGDARELAKVGIFLGSLLSGIAGYLVLRFAATPHPQNLEASPITNLN